MALLRVIGVALVACGAVALVAYRPAGADADPAAAPGRDRAHPDGWKQLPSIAAAVGAAAKAEGVTVDAVDAWGERADGCYAVWLALHGASGDAPALAEQVLAGLSKVQVPRPGEPTARSKENAPAAHAAGSKETAPPAQAAGAPKGRRNEGAAAGELAISELVKPAGREGVMAFTFAGAPFRGRVRAQLGGGRIAAVACFGNERAPVACDAACARVLEATP